MTSDQITVQIMFDNHILCIISVVFLAPWGVRCNDHTMILPTHKKGQITASVHPRAPISHSPSNWTSRPKNMTNIDLSQWTQLLPMVDPRSPSADSQDLRHCSLCSRDERFK